jgi:putative DNA primase/helicase
MVDNCLILEGPQGRGKSSLVRILGEPYFTDDIGDLGSKDSLLQMQGKWIVEFSELDALSRHEASRVKAFITRRWTISVRPTDGWQLMHLGSASLLAP